MLFFLKALDMEIAGLWMMIFSFSVNIGLSEGKFEPTKVYDQNVLKAAFPMSPNDIQWGHGYNSLKLYPTFNSAVDVRAIDEEPKKSIKIQLKACKTGGETFSFLAGELSTAGTFLTLAPSTLNEYFRTSQVTELSTVLVIKIDVITKVAEIKDFTLTNRAKSFFALGNFKDYARFYGTHCLKRAIYGGYLYITMEFSSVTRKGKEAIDRQLSDLPENYDSVSQLKDVLRQLHQREALQINIFTVGGKNPPSKPDISGVIRFAEEFMQSIEVQQISQVHHIEYHSMFQIYDASFGFRYYALPIQEKVDMVVQISAALKDVICRTNSILELREKDKTYSFISSKAVNKIRGVKDETITLRTDLKNKFSSWNEDELESLIASFKEFSCRAEEGLSVLLKNEKKFDASKKFYLRSKGIGRYVSIDKDHYPRLTDTSPIRLKFTRLNGVSNKQILYHHQFLLITSDTTPNYYLCMGKNSWYVFWDHHLNVDISKCTWHLKPASSKVNVEAYVGFSDILLIYNQHWPGYVIGTTDDGQWLLTATKESAERQTRHQWTIEKTPF
jgi:hypothetical protein